ncbi:VirB4 family type IV secretion system protein [Pseudomonas syringae group genomosp. 3]|uniref:VirB4 family type IV secretion system protein n=1 Tax=Pseudomonas syringae group genomosp. 3 TaxID=251701 RepID=UPI00217FC9BC|nr:conjugal transfer protein [Pseudomonas syringae group genomosp. 3]
MRYPVHEHMVTLPGNRLVSLIQLKGVSSETRSDDELVHLFHNLNRYFLALGKKEGKHLMLQTYITKTGIELDTPYTLPLPALQDFVDAYTAPFRNGTFYQVGYSIALILKYREVDEGIERMSDLLSLSSTLLAEYDPAIMGLEENEHGALFSQIGRYYSLLINGHEKDVLVSDTRLGDAIIDSVTNFENYDFVENRPNRGGQRFATTFDLRDYPSGGTYPGMWDEAIEQQFEFTLVQTFLFEDRNKAKDKFKKHVADLGSVERDSKQTEELENAIEAITLGDKAFGRYHASLIVYGKTPDQAIENGTKMASVFTVRDATFVRSTMSNIDTWYTQFPGVTEAMYPMMKSTENLACSFSLHSTPTGKVKGNPIGDGTGLMPVLTANQALYVLNVHDSPPGQNNLGEMLPGHAVFTGQTGVGKTTVEATLLTFLSRFDPLIFGIDYNESLRHLLCALGAEYYTVQPGHFTGVNPFQFHDSPGLRQMLIDLMLCCAGGPAKTDEADQRTIKDSVEAVMAVTNVRLRGMSLLLQNIPHRGGNCLHTRLSKWCRLAGEGREGQYAWVLDSPINQFNAQTYRRLAFDCTQLLKNDYAERHPEVMEAFLNTLFYMKREMHQARPGNLLLNVVAEYWAPLSFKSTADAIKEVLQSGRMRGEILIMDTQYPEQALATPYAAAVIQQVTTPIWLPNKKAQAESYAKFGVTGKVFEAVRDMGPLSREMVVQQGHQTVKLKMELDGPLKYWLPLLSATQKNLAVAERIRQHLGTTDPKVWVDAFLVAEAVRQWLNTDDPAVWLPAFDYAENLRQSMKTRDAQRWMPAFQKAWKAIQEHNEMEDAS